MATTITAGNATNGAAISSDNTGILELKTGTGSGTTALTLGTTGNINFPISGQRITGDFSNATVANRVLFQTSTTNSSTIISAIPNGTGVAGQFAAYNNSDPTNSSTLVLSSLSAEARVAAGIAGTGTYLPMTFYTGGSERARIDTSGNLQFNSGYGSVATAYGCRAWVNFNGTGTVAIRASGNVTSITDNGTGDYTLNFTTAMPDINYSTVGTTGVGSSSTFTIITANYAGNGAEVPPTTSAVRVVVSNITTLQDGKYVNIAIFR